MAVAAHDDIDRRHGRGQLFVRLEAGVADQDDAGDALALEGGHGPAHGREDFFEFDARPGARHFRALGVRQAHDADLVAGHLAHHEGARQAAQFRGGRQVEVGGHHRKVQGLQKGGQGGRAVVEFMAEEPLCDYTPGGSGPA